MCVDKKMPDLKHVNALSYLQLHANRTVNLTINQTKTNYIMGISNQKYLLHDKKKRGINKQILSNTF